MPNPNKERIRLKIIPSVNAVSKLIAEPIVNSKEYTIIIPAQNKKYNAM